MSQPLSTATHPLPDSFSDSAKARVGPPASPDGGGHSWASDERILIWRDAGLSFGRWVPENEHAHHLFEMVVPLDGTIDVLVEGKEILRRTECAMISVDLPHQVILNGNHVVSFWVVPETPLGLGLRRYSDGAPAMALPSAFKERGLELADALTGFAGKLGHETAGIEDLVRSVFTTTVDPSALASSLDPRVQHALDLLVADPSQPLPISLIAQRVGVSGSHLRALFRRDVGTTLANYRLGLQVRLALELIVQGHSVTDAAMEAGFADLAHLSRASTRMCGNSPSSSMNPYLDTGSPARALVSPEWLWAPRVTKD